MPLPEILNSRKVVIFARPPDNMKGEKGGNKVPPVRVVYLPPYYRVA